MKIMENTMENSQNEQGTLKKYVPPKAWVEITDSENSAPISQSRSARSNGVYSCAGFPTVR